MILEEDFKNLNMIDRSLISNLKLKTSNNFSPDCEVIVDKVKPIERHSFNTIIEIVKEPDVAAVVFRAARRQLLLIGYKVGEDFNRSNYNNFFVKFSDYAMDRIDDVKRYPDEQTVDSEAVVKTMISTAFLGFFKDADQSVKKVWDLLIIKKSDVSPLRQGRKESQKDIAVLPKDKEKYAEYLKKMKNNLEARLERYIDSKRPELKSKEDILKLFTTSKAMNKIRVNDKLYKLTKRTSNSNNTEITLNYDLDEKSEASLGTDIKNIRIIISYKSIFPEIESVRFYSSSWDPMNSDILPMRWN